MNKYIEIKKAKTGGKKVDWDIINKKSKQIIGVISYHYQWRRYIFLPRTMTIWDVECLKEIIEFIEGIR